VNSQPPTELAADRKPFATLRRFIRPRIAKESCELCAAGLAPEHTHLLDLTKWQLVCACEACAILFSGQHNGRYRRVPRCSRRLVDFRLTDERWESLPLPISLAFFFHNSRLGKVVAQYPSPAGSTESLLPLEAWEELAADNPILRTLEPDVEALLVNREGAARMYYLTPIDECYKLVGLIRTHWRGLSGGPKVWEEIDRFFAGLKERSLLSPEAR
jgi:Family of unknown function (DUF5947)